jgi:hypothetical protein
MGTGRRLAVLLLAFGVIGLPAAVMRIGCVGDSCRSTAVAAAPVPFCSLPADLRELISAGTSETRSPDVMAVAASTPVVSDVSRGVEVPWPSVDEAQRSAMAAPLWFVGRGIDGGRLPRDLTFDRVAPTLSELLGVRRPHPDVRSGTSIPGVTQPGATTPLVVLIVWKGIGTDQEPRFRLSADLVGASPTAQLASSNGDGSTFVEGRRVSYLRGVKWAVGSATAGSLPLDPTAVEATIGTGGLPSQHGIVGTEIRNKAGDVVAAFGPHSPQPVIATLGDDLDRATGGRARIGLIASSIGDAALTGDDWYHDHVGSIVDRTAHVAAGGRVDVASFLADGWGSDQVPDLLAIGLAGTASSDERATNAVQSQVLRAVPDATIVVAGTGSLTTKHAVTAPAPPGTDTIVAGGAFVDRGAAAVPAQQVVDALHAQTAPDGSPLYSDAFASYAVRFGRYC